MEVKVILVGNGYFGSLYRQRLESNSKFELVGIVEPNYENFKDLKAATIGHDYKTLADNVDHDAVVIAAPPSQHASVAYTAMDNGKHVLCAKPGALSMTDLYMLHGIANAANVFFMVDYTSLWSPENRFVDDLIVGMGGLPTSMASTRFVSTPAKPEGAIWDLLCHDVAFYHYHFYHERPTSVECEVTGNQTVAIINVGKREVAYMKASYESKTPQKNITVNANVLKRMTNPGVKLHWNQEQRFVSIASQGRSVDFHFKHEPDPISMALDRLLNERYMATEHLRRHSYVTSILHAMQHSANNKGINVGLDK